MVWNSNNYMLTDEGMFVVSKTSENDPDFCNCSD